MSFPNRSFSALFYRSLIVLFVAAVVVTLPIFFFGIPHGNDLPQHYQFALTFYDSLQSGNFYPEWSSVSNFGFGDVGIRFYPPLSYYVLIAFRFFAGNWYDASVLTFCFWFFISGIGIYLWAREWFGENASLAAALIYIAAPYHVNQIYNAFTYAEFAASSILPFCFLFVTRICRNGKPTNIICFAVFYALLILTHLPMTVMGSLGLLIYSLASLPKGNRIPTLAKLGISGIMGLLASSFYWLRMITELDFVKHATKDFTSQAYDYHSNFLAAFLYVSPIEYDGRSLWFSDLMLLITIGLFLPSAIIFYYCSKGKIKPKLNNVAYLLVFAIFISTPLSLFIWEHFGTLQKIQFPWRWLAVISMSGIIFAAAGFDYLVESFQTKLRPLALIAVGLIIAGLVFTATQVVKPAIYVSRAEFTERIDKLSSAESYECWWTIWAKKAAFDLPDKVLAENRSVQIIKWQPNQREIVFSSGLATDARIAAFYYPHWRASINGQPAEIGFDNNGVMFLPLPGETANVKIWFQEPVYNCISRYISLITWLAFGIAGLFFIRKERLLNFPQ